MNFGGTCIEKGGKYYIEQYEGFTVNAGAFGYLTAAYNYGEIYNLMGYELRRLR